MDGRSNHVHLSRTGEILRGVGRFVYDFVIGDDWKIAAAVGCALLVGVLLAVLRAPAAVTVLGTAGLIGAAFTVAMILDVRRGARE
jgi:hypothetical protein